MRKSQQVSNVAVALGIEPRKMATFHRDAVKVGVLKVGPRGINAKLLDQADVLGLTLHACQGLAINASFNIKEKFEQQGAVVTAFDLEVGLKVQSDPERPIVRYVSVPPEALRLAVGFAT